MEWQPIETAPKDGPDRILLCDDSFVFEGHYAWENWWDDVTDSLRNPTHWMPLPDPPKA